MAKRRKRRGFGRAIVREERLLRDREAIRVLREHFTGYETRDGYSLDVRKIARLPRHVRASLRKKFAKVRPLLAGTYDLVKPRTEKEAKALRAFTHQRLRRLKHFIVKTPTPGSYVKVRGEKYVEVHTRQPGAVEVTEAYFTFPKRARRPSEMVQMLKKMLPTMPQGQYVLQTDTYGDTGSIVDRGQLVNRLQTYLADYDRSKYGEHRFLNRVVGFRWMSTKVEGAEVQQGVRDTIRARVRESNRKRREALRREAAKRARKLQ